MVQTDQSEGTAGALDSIEEFRRLLDKTARTAPPQSAALALWLAARPDEVAFKSVRQLAQSAGTNPNTVVRLASALGYDGYGPLQTAVRALLRPGAGPYAQRAAALGSHAIGTLTQDMTAAACTNLQAFQGDAVHRQIEETVQALLTARQVHCIGVRSCYSVAHYLSYAGAMALPNFQPTPAQPGLLADVLSACTPDDIVIAISYAHYSSEVVRGVRIARDCGARVIAMTDSYASPLAEGAWQVFRLRMEGPQVLPSLLSAFHLCEILLAELVARSTGSEPRIREFERRMLAIGAYLRGDPSGG